MFDLNGPFLSRRLTLKLARWNRRVKGVLTKLADWPPPVRLACALTLLALLTLCAGCATTSAPSDFTPRNPEPPPTRLSLPSQTYSSSAAADIQKWRNRLTELLQKP